MPQKNLFMGNSKKFKEVDIEAPLALSPTPCAWCYTQQYADEAKRAEETGQAQTAATYRFLQMLTSFGQSFDTPEEPFRPQFVFQDRRGVVPSDLSEADIDALRELAPLVQDASLRARLFDVLWVTTKDHKAMARAAASYLEAAEKLNTIEWSFFAESHYQRAIQLAARMGRGKKLFGDVSTSIQRAAETAAKDLRGRRLCGYLRLITITKCDDFKRFARLGARAAKKATKRAEPAVARDYWEATASLYKAARDKEKEKAAQLAAAETYVAEAKKRKTGSGKSALAAARLLQRAIEGIRRAGGKKERIASLRRQLLQLQKESLKEMTPISTTFSIGKIVRQSRKYVKCLNLDECFG